MLHIVARFLALIDCLSQCLHQSNLILHYSKAHQLIQFSHFCTCNLIIEEFKQSRDIIFVLVLKSLQWFISQFDKFSYKNHHYSLQQVLMHNLPVVDCRIMKTEVPILYHIPWCLELTCLYYFNYTTICAFYSTLNSLPLDNS